MSRHVEHDLYWWLYPSRMALFVLVPIYLGCASFTREDYLLYKQHHVFFAGYHVWLGLAGLIAFAICAFCAELGADGKARKIEIEPHVLRVFLAWLYAVTLGAYAIFLFPIVLNPDLVRELAFGSKGAASDLRETLDRIPGITTLVTLQSLCVVLHLLHRRITGQPAPRLFQVQFAVVLVFCLLRGWLWSERLAILEFVVPIVVATFVQSGHRRKRLIAAAPLLAVPVVFGLFAAGEYFRSWQFYSASWDGSFVSFAWARFVGYYATALNNGALLSSMMDTAYFPVNTAAWLYRFPLWPVMGISFPGDILGDASPSIINVEAALKTYANVEFNNCSGIFQPFLDYGPIGGVLCWGALGAMSGLLFKSFANSRPLGLILYPAWYVGILEILRIFYWGDGRFFPVLVIGLLLAAYFAARAGQRARNAAAKRVISPHTSRGGYA